jgi:starch synthase
MDSRSVLFISQEITPYTPETERSLMGRNLSVGVAEKGYAVRTFMPRWKNINERRHQLHEVIRLSGMNLIIEGIDHVLVIKVASLAGTRLQVYFIDSDDYFRNVPQDAYNTDEFKVDNDNRMTFYARGVLETVKKLRWQCDIVHCEGWPAALTPLYLKTSYQDDPAFSSSKVVFSVFDDDLPAGLQPNIAKKIAMRGLTEKELIKAGQVPHDYASLLMLAIRYSDGVVLHTENVPEGVKEYIAKLGTPCVQCTGDKEADSAKLAELYEKI